MLGDFHSPKEQENNHQLPNMLAPWTKKKKKKKSADTEKNLDKNLQQL